MSWEQVLVIVNIVATVGGVVALLLKFESRMTRVETLLEYLLPHARRADQGERQ